MVSYSLHNIHYCLIGTQPYLTIATRVSGVRNSLPKVAGEFVTEGQFS